MGGNPATEKREELVKKLLEDVDSVLKTSIESRDALSGLPPSKAQAMQSYVQGHKAKVAALLNVYKAANRYEALEREKMANGWLKAATLMDLGRYSMEAIKTGAEAAVNFEAARVALSNPAYAKQLTAVSEKIVAIAGAPVAALEAISEAIQAIDAWQRGDKEAFARSAGKSASGTIQVVLFVVQRGYAGAATGAAAAGAGVTFVITLYVEGILAMGQLNDILRQIRIDKERRALQAIVERAYVVAGLARSMFANYQTFGELLASSAEEAVLVAEVYEAEGRRLAAHLGSLTRRLEEDSKLSEKEFPKGLIKRMWMASIGGDGTTLTGQKQLLQEALVATAAYVALRLHELELIRQNAIGHQMLHLRTEWRL
jgi:hypothetical protein